MNEVWKNIVSTVAAIALVGLFGLLWQLRTDVTVNTAVETQRWNTAKAQHQMYSKSFESYEARIRLIENNIYAYHGAP